MTVSDLAMWTAKRQPVHACESQRHCSRSADLQTSRRDQARDDVACLEPVSIHPG